jgi:tetratricopeptide (TPR) repeat protein
MEAARRGLALNPRSEPLLIRAAYLCVQLHDFKQATQYAALVEPSRPSIAHDVRARVALANGNAGQAESEARAALASGRESADIHYTLARVALAKNDPTGALAELDAAQRILDRNGDHMRNLNHDRGFVLAGLGREAEARKAFEEEIRLFPDNAFAYKNLIVFYGVHGRVSDEARLIDTLIAGYPSGPAYAAVADAMRMLGKNAAARQALRDGLARYPGDPELEQVKSAMP